MKEKSATYQDDIKKNQFCSLPLAVSETTKEVNRTNTRNMLVLPNNCNPSSSPGNELYIPSCKLNTS